MIDITAVDYPQNEKRFKIVYLLLSHENNLRIIINIEVDEKEIIPSITKIFPSANWMEREIYDMYGLSFKDHPDLRKILTDYGRGVKDNYGFKLQSSLSSDPFKTIQFHNLNSDTLYPVLRIIYVK